MARCENCGRSPMAGNNVSHSKRHTRRRWFLNVQKATIDINGKRKQLNLCTRCMRTHRKAKLSIQGG